MHYFADDVIIPLLKSHGYRTLCEIGAQHGGNTDRLLAGGAGHITVIDPCVGTDLAAKYRQEPRVTVIRGRSLDVLPTLDKVFDAFLIDGDHNWYTVFNELRTIERRGLLRRGGLILLHDVAWPYGRRDLYYAPETIPAEFRRPYAKKGIVRGRSFLVETGGANGWLDNALEEGGPQNGVLTAIEDFLAGTEKTYHYFPIDQEHGLGLLFYGKPPGRGAVV